MYTPVTNLYRRIYGMYLHRRNTVEQCFSQHWDAAVEGNRAKKEEEKKRKEKASAADCRRRHLLYDNDSVERSSVDASPSLAPSASRPEVAYPSWPVLIDAIMSRLGIGAYWSDEYANMKMSR